MTVVVCDFARADVRDIVKAHQGRFAFWSIRSTSALAREKLALPNQATVGSPPRLAVCRISTNVLDAVLRYYFVKKNASLLSVIAFPSSTWQKTTAKKEAPSLRKV
jgi:hypothetical protein